MKYATLLPDFSKPARTPAPIPAPVRVIAVAGRMGTGKDTVAAKLASRGFVRIAFADKLKQIARRIFGFDAETLFGPSEARNRTVLLDDDAWEAAFYNAGLAAEDIGVTVMAGSHSGRTVPPDLTPRRVQAHLHAYMMNCRARARVGQFSARVALQLLGTEFGRTLREDVWIVAIEQPIYEVCSGYAYDPLLGVDYKNFDRDREVGGIIITDCRFPNEAQAIREMGGEVYWVDASKRLSIPPSTHASEPDKEAFRGLLAGTIDNNGTLDDLDAELARVSHA